MNNRCIVCNQELDVDKHSLNDNAAYVPNIYEGVVFRSSGQFGSTLWDEDIYLHREMQIIVCDKCLKDRSKDIDVIYEERVEKTAKYQKLNEALNR